MHQCEAWDDPGRIKRHCDLSCCPNPVNRKELDSSKNAVQQAESTLHHDDIVGQVQHGRSGFLKRRPCWSKAASIEHRKMVNPEIHQQEESSRCAKAVSWAKQGQWIRCGSVEKRKISWKGMLDMEAGRISFLICTAYDILPSPQNLNQWLGEDPHWLHRKPHSKTVHLKT